jgi:hypothetical protein
MTFVITLTFFLSTPGVAEATAGGFPAISAPIGQFLLKDLVYSQHLSVSYSRRSLNTRKVFLALDSPDLAARHSQFFHATPVWNVDRPGEANNGHPVMRRQRPLYDLRAPAEKCAI